MRHRRATWTTGADAGDLLYEIPSPPPGADLDADLEMCFTAPALADLLASVGALPPESGAKLFGPVNGFGVDVVEFDIHGSAVASGAVYSPDIAWGTARLDHWITQEGDDQRIWTGDAHSHPGDLGRPSPKVGPGLGDLGYTEAVFEQNEIQNEFLIPILTRTGRGDVVRIAPWLVHRSAPTHPRWVSFRVTAAADFPERRFNPAFGAEPVVEAEVDPEQIDLPGSRRRDISTDSQGQTIVEVEIPGGLVTVRLDEQLEPVGVDVLDDEGTERRIRVARPTSGAGRVTERLLAAGAELLGGLAGSGVGSRRPGPESAAETGDAPQPNDPSPASPAVAPIDAAAYHARTRTLLTPSLRERTVVVAGASGGSHLIEKLARMGPRRIIVMDPDVVEVANLPRTAFRASQVGELKVDAVAAIVADANPMVEVTGIARDLTSLDLEEIRDLLSDVDLIVAGTDSFLAQATLNRWSQLTGTPAVFIGMHAGAAGGQIIWSVPGETACYRCTARTRYDDGAAGAPVDLPGEPGLLPDVQIVDMFALNVILGLLQRGEDTPKGRLIARLDDRTEIIVTTDPGYDHGRALWSALTADLPPATNRTADLETYLGLFPVITLPSAPQPGCPDCQLHAPAQEV